MVSKCIVTTFHYNILCVLTIISRKLQVIYRRSTYRTTVLELDVRYNWHVMALNKHRSVLPISHLCILTCIACKLKVIYGCSAYRTTALLLEMFLEWIRVAWEIRLEIYSPRHTSVLLDTTLCKYTAGSYIHHHLVHNYASQKLIKHMKAYYTPNDGFAANNA